MQSERFSVVRALTASILVAIFAAPQSLVSQVSDHLVSSADLQKAVTGASKSRQQNLDSLQTFFSSDRSRQALRSAHMNPEQVKTAIAGLSDEELTQLATRANRAQADFAAGSMSDRDLILIILAIAALILIIVAVR
jgi:hypothetical protein